MTEKIRFFIIFCTKQPSLRVSKEMIKIIIKGNYWEEDYIIKNKVSFILYFKELGSIVCYSKD